MADTPKEKTETTVQIPKEDVEKAAKLVLDPGYVTKKDLPKMADLEWATALSDAVMKHFLNDDDDHDPYVYFEQFDFDGGDIDSIIFNMDIVKTRDAGLHKLSEALGEKIIDNKVQQTTY
ncbi:MAG: hypothetical protein LKH74_03005 [Levilactobacillus sp.]|jgi:hypothetical protein|uniref:Uncharacterized protein n=1 Tax=Levilactobacillus suantsaiihabitans TaxID=2487722 RepID=A0A4Z0JB70_9LACO|nr:MULTISPECIES: hypothetical protein [Levilactobacillus]MCI1552869.1 hypothetical protein [Levilactobacillus sp.]MCI1605935.1 hypothetical protein [Levilactobacillus sp.]TGD20065.1 hypothetical protein EGT51_02415 [Levilactobacillus suantsaiihabitans]